MKKILFFCLLALINQTSFASLQPATIAECSIGNIKIINKIPSHMTGDNENYYKVIARSFINNYGINTQKTGEIILQETNNSLILPSMWGIKEIIACDSEHHKLDLIYMIPIAKKNLRAK